MSFVEAGGSFLLRGSVSRGRAGGVAWRGGVVGARDASEAGGVVVGCSWATRGAPKAVQSSWSVGNRRRRREPAAGQRPVF